MRRSSTAASRGMIQTLRCLGRSSLTAPCCPRRIGAHHGCGTWRCVSDWTAQKQRAGPLRYARSLYPTRRTSVSRGASETITRVSTQAKRGSTKSDRLLVQPVLFDTRHVNDAVGVSEPNACSFKNPSPACRVLHSTVVLLRRTRRAGR